MKRYDKKGINIIGDLPYLKNENLNPPPKPMREQEKGRRGEGGLPPLAPQPPLIRLTPEAFKKMIEDASTRIAERAICHFMTNKKREHSPPILLARPRHALHPRG
ncbi:UNVERIFIED_CONTAM: hypothetical protein Slati_0147800 [Sesamum latifolium]|uniref:Uncharacterized protein n=1 Tax=Sesamum latifolium TaxID=2727402 RepID=A0AAW2Y9T8_9LAMI